MIPPSPIAIDSAINPDEASISEAPADLRPCTTTAKELENPTNPARSPAATAWIENERKISIWFPSAKGRYAVNAPNIPICRVRWASLCSKSTHFKILT